MKALRDVNKAGFGPVLEPNYLTTIKDFETARLDLYIDFGMYFSNKCYVIMEHIPQAIVGTAKLLYLSSKQVVESAHTKFDKKWGKFIKGLILGGRPMVINY